MFKFSDPSVPVIVSPLFGSAASTNTSIAQIIQRLDALTRAIQELQAAANSLQPGA